MFRIAAGLLAISVLAASHEVRAQGRTLRVVSTQGTPIPFATAWIEGGTARIADEMDRVNPVYIPRNHLVETALAAASAGDLAPLDALMEVLAHPFDERDGLDDYTRPMPTDWEGYQTFCGT